MKNFVNNLLNFYSDFLSTHYTASKNLNNRFNYIDT